jgi:hypothetical protein
MTEVKVEDLDLNTVVFYANIHHSDSGGYIMAGKLARALLAERGLDYRNLEYHVMNYGNSGKRAILCNNEFRRFE